MRSHPPGLADNTSVPALSVLLPVCDVESGFEQAVGCLLDQTLTDIEILIIANGAHESDHPRLYSAAKSDSRIRLEFLPRANLAAALNHGMRVARAAIVARMDGDDWCPPDRLEKQLAALESRPDLLALGCAFEVLDARGEIIAINYPPTDPREALWRLHLSNPFAHGSILMRRTEVLTETGGYDESLSRAQDYDLWLRLAPRIGAISDILYRYSAHAGKGFSSSPEQAHAGANCITRAWSRLAPGDAASYSALIAAAMGTASQRDDAQRELADRLTREGPTSAGLMAWMWMQSCGSFPNAACASSADREDKLQRAIAQVQAAGVTRLYLWGAGAHTAWALDKIEFTGIQVAGIVDDFVHGRERLGRVVMAPSMLRRGDHVLLSSDRSEDAMWDKAAVARAAGVNVWRVYGERSHRTA